MYRHRIIPLISTLLTITLSWQGMMWAKPDIYTLRPKPSAERKEGAKGNIKGQDPTSKTLFIIDPGIVARYEGFKPVVVFRGFIRDFSKTRLGPGVEEKTLWEIFSNWPEKLFCPSLSPINNRQIEFKITTDTKDKEGNIRPAAYSEPRKADFIQLPVVKIHPFVLSRLEEFASCLNVTLEEARLFRQVIFVDEIWRVQGMGDHKYLLDFLESNQDYLKAVLKVIDASNQNGVSAEKGWQERLQNITEERRVDPRTLPNKPRILFIIRWHGDLFNILKVAARLGLISYGGVDIDNLDDHLDMDNYLNYGLTDENWPAYCRMAGLTTYEPGKKRLVISIDLDYFGSPAGYDFDAGQVVGGFQMTPQEIRKEVEDTVNKYRDEDIAMIIIATSDYPSAGRGSYSTGATLKMLPEMVEILSKRLGISPEDIWDLSGKGHLDNEKGTFLIEECIRGSLSEEKSSLSPDLIRTLLKEREDTGLKLEEKNKRKEELKRIALKLIKTSLVGPFREWLKEILGTKMIYRASNVIGPKIRGNLSMLYAIFPIFAYFTNIFRGKENYLTDHTLAVLEHLEEIWDNRRDEFNKGLTIQNELSKEEFAEFHRLFDEIAKSPDDRELLFLTFLLHDIGVFVSVEGHPERSAELAEVILEHLGYSKEAIDRAVWLILHHVDIGALTTRDRNASYFIDELNAIEDAAERDWRHKALILLTLCDVRSVSAGKWLTPKVKGLYIRYMDIQNLIADQNNWHLLRLDFYAADDAKRKQVLALYDQLAAETKTIFDNQFRHIKVFEHAQPTMEGLSAENLLKLCLLMSLISEYYKNRNRPIFRIDFPKPTDKDKVNLNACLDRFNLTEFSPDNIEKLLSSDTRAIFGIPLHMEEIQITKERRSWRIFFDTQAVQLPIQKGQPKLNLEAFPKAQNCI